MGVRELVCDNGRGRIIADMLRFWARSILRVTNRGMNLFISGDSCLFFND